MCLDFYQYGASFLTEKTTTVKPTERYRNTIWHSFFGTYFNICYKHFKKKVFCFIVPFNDSI